MKKLVLTVFFTLMLYCSANANTIVNVPIDSRPISDEYLENLAKIGRDEYISVDKKNMDFFSSYEPDNHIGNSAEIRKEVKDIVSTNNNDSTTVIINTSSYITNGLVGSRCGVNYENYKEALSELESLLRNYPEPKYYVNMPMPRTLPETRFNQVWSDNEKIKGIGWYYLQANPDTELNAEINQKYANVTPEQALMEYSYVENKALELGGYNKLTKWERDFIISFNFSYKTKEPYKSYVEYYKNTYEDCADIFDTLIKFRQEGILDEVVVSNDDLQLPDSITYFNSKGADWIQKEEGSPIKYSFARTYSQIAPTSMMRVIKDTYGADELTKARLGRSDFVNIINGTDEVPQLIYARDYSKRKNLTSQINVVYNKVSENVGAYDVKRAGTVTNAAINFASGNVGIFTEKPVDMYIYNYATEGNKDVFVNNIRSSLSKGNNTALIELFGTGSVSKGNYIFEKLLSSDTLHKLCAYSAWNTNGNAIGLGIAQAQVFSVAKQLSKEPHLTVKAQAEMLLQHFIEDGIYTSRVKRELSNEGYRPNVEDRTNSQMLYDRLAPEKLINALKGHIIEVNGNKYQIKNITVDKTSFPWGRTFDILVESTAEVKSVK